MNNLNLCQSCGNEGIASCECLLVNSVAKWLYDFEGEGKIGLSAYESDAEDLVNVVRQYFTHSKQESNTQKPEPQTSREREWMDAHGDIVKHSDLYDECPSCRAKEDDLNILRARLDESNAANRRG